MIKSKLRQIENGEVVKTINSMEIYIQKFKYPVNKLESAY